MKETGGGGGDGWRVVPIRGLGSSDARDRNRGHQRQGCVPRSTGSGQGNPGQAPGHGVLGCCTSPPETCSASMSGRRPLWAARPRASWIRAKLVPDEVIIGMVRRPHRGPDALDPDGSPSAAECADPPLTEKDAPRESGTGVLWVVGGSWMGSLVQLPQARAWIRVWCLTQAALDAGLGLTVVVYFNVPDAALIERLTGRRTCTGCGAIWHVTFHTATNPSICDQCSRAAVAAQRR